MFISWYPILAQTLMLPGTLLELILKYLLLAPYLHSNINVSYISSYLSFYKLVPSFSLYLCTMLSPLKSFVHAICAKATLWICVQTKS